MKVVAKIFSRPVTVYLSQIRSQAVPLSRPQTTNSGTTTTVQIRPQQQQQQHQIHMGTQPVRAQQKSVQVFNSVQTKTGTSPAGGAQLKQIVTNNNLNINNNNNNNNNTKSNNKNQVSIGVVPTSSPSPVIHKSNASPNKITTPKIQQQNNSHNAPSSHNDSHHTTPKKSQGSMKAKEKKTLLASVVQQVSAASANASGSGSNAMSSFYPSSSTFGDDDINDVAAMGGVNLAEESQRILGSTEFVGTQIRSCKDEVLLNLPILQQRIRQQMARHGLDDPSTDIAVLISHAAQERLKNIIEKLAVIAEHRIDILKVNNLKVC